MQPIRIIILVLLTLVCVPNARSAADRKPIFAHYMPWYDSKPVSGHWGWHWTMNRYDPDKIDNTEKREIAAHDYPLIGPYDSNDPHALECHVLLMKLGGLDGVIVDWYGIKDFRDYGTIHRNTKHLIRFIKRAGLQFAICYEDQTVNHMIEGKALPASDGVAHGKEVMGWLSQNWLKDPAYFRVNNRPALLVFGPQHYSPGQWKQVMRGMGANPVILGLPHLSGKYDMSGAFGWPPVTGGKDISVASRHGYLRRLYARTKDETIAGAVFPGFRDIYEQAGLHDSYGFISERDGKTFSETLDTAERSGCAFIQVATWNDYGEGTVIEPTRRSGYRYLAEIQKHERVKYRPDDLKLPVRLYELRKKHARNESVTAKLELASAALFQGNTKEAARLLTSVR
ncbi:MAG: hypothetical protein CMO80_10900 [Verrucomicrobiales bacterium]|nr:hypothetical protein [Verrucomicrobiales bacterium]|tara:strand:+ start:12024 stop:13217 length:1194 start_codon:yes stop_codon:yes gene_type:complete